MLRRYATFSALPACSSAPASAAAPASLAATRISKLTAVRCTRNTATVARATFPAASVAVYRYTYVPGRHTACTTARRSHDRPPMSSWRTVMAAVRSPSRSSAAVAQQLIPPSSVSGALPDGHAASDTAAGMP